MKPIVRKGFTHWLKKESPDILCLQETHLSHDQVSTELKAPYPYKSYWDFEEDTDFSGVAIYTKFKPRKIHYDVGLPWFDEEGKIMVLEFDNFSLVNVRMPHGGKARGTMEMKLNSLREFLGYADYIKDFPVIICGTFNVAHRNIDMSKPKEYEFRPTFTLKEKGYMNDLLNKGFIDTFRLFNQETGQYTYWRSERDREKNLGKRIDYIFVTKNIIRTVKQAFILPRVHGSDHCPVGIELENLAEPKISLSYSRARR